MDYHLEVQTFRLPYCHEGFSYLKLCS